MTKSLETIHFELAELATGSTGSPVLTGKAVVYGVPYPTTNPSLSLRGYRDVVTKGALSWDPRNTNGWFSANVNHLVSQQLGRGDQVTIHDEDAYLGYSVPLGDDPHRVAERVATGELKGSSITFYPDEFHLDEVNKIRYITGARVAELGPVESPASPPTDVSVRFTESEDDKEPSSIDRLRNPLIP